MVSEHWKTCVYEALNEVGIIIADSELVQVSEMLDRAECQEHVPMSPENEPVKKCTCQATGCTRCDGRGYRNVFVGSSHQSTDDCLFCKGTGAIIL